jgi:hypothetical protein
MRSLLAFMTHGEWVISILTAIYVVLTFFYTRYSRKTLEEIKKQGIANSKQLEVATIAAKAAKQSADAQMNVERAWIIAMWEDMAAYNPTIVIDGNPADFMHHHFIWGMKNIGNQPAFPTAYAHRFIHITSLEDLPSIPDYGHVYKLTAEPLVDSLPGQFVVSLESSMKFTEVESTIRKHESFIYAFGFIEYRDIHGRAHRSRFGLVYDVWLTPTRDYDHFRFDGPEAYNGYD